MTLYIFAGPSVARKYRNSWAEKAVVLPPVEQGDLFRIPARAGDSVAIIDGYFCRKPAVKHKEILDLLARGVHVHGASSMGALRAAELADFGMVGHGRIFTDYYNGVVCSDDEVAFLHGTEAEDYEPLSEALINLRYAVFDAQQDGRLPAGSTERVIPVIANLPFMERSLTNIANALASADFSSDEVMQIQDVLAIAPNVKQSDAIAMVDSLLRATKFVNVACNWELRNTAYLRTWRIAEQGCGENINPSKVHRFAQVMAVDYPIFREHSLATILAATGNIDATHDATTQASGYEIEKRVICKLRALGIIAPDSEFNDGLSRWLTREEQHLPPRSKTVKAATRALFTTQLLSWQDPLLAILARVSNYPAVLEQAVECQRFNQQLKEQNPRFRFEQIRPANIVSHFSARWSRSNFDDAVLERGFASVEEFVRRARTFYLFDKHIASRGPEHLALRV
ncbi:TfuA-like protein [Streptomyces sp. NPDC001286]